VKRALWILWPSFVVGALATAVFFSATDWHDLALGERELSRTAAYSIGFFFFWAVAAASSAFSSFLQGTR
jgi:hypothetical protein